MEALSDTTTELNPRGEVLEAVAVAAENGAGGRQRLIPQVELGLTESGHSEAFDAAAWVDRWLHRPNHALGGAAPELYLHTPGGAALLCHLIGAIEEICVDRRRSYFGSANGCSNWRSWVNQISSCVLQQFPRLGDLAEHLEVETSWADKKIPLDWIFAKITSLGTSGRSRSVSTSHF